jgi:pyruvate,orthophosphate dikinase
VKRLHEQNPMLGLRGVRLGIVIPGLFTMQARAILEAAAERTAAGGDPQPEIMIPLVATVKELDLVRAEIDKVAAEVNAERGVEVAYKVGTMIELPRAAVTADKIAASAEFFSFGTNDLTQMAFGFSRDDAGKFLRVYQDKKILERDPFQSFDGPGTGQLVDIAACAAASRATGTRYGDMLT